MPALSREKLHELVWNEPVRKVAQRLGMSDVGLRKHCLAARVPLPERGYWAKLAAGKNVQRARLLPREPGASAVVQVGREPHRWNATLEERLAEPVPERPQFPEPLEQVRRRMAQRLGRVRAARDLESPNASIAKLLEADARRIQKSQEYKWSWEKPLFASPFERRRLRILNSLAAGLAKVGAKLEVRGESGREIYVNVGVTPVSVALDHPAAKPTRYGEWQTREGPAAELKLTIGKETTSDFHRPH